MRFLVLFLSVLCFSMNCWAEFWESSLDFDADMCENGHSSRWANACVCDDPNEFSGKYCSEQMIRSCFSNADCPPDAFCLIRQEKGSCFPTQIRNKLETSKAIYVLSDALLSYLNADAFCSSLGKGYRPVSRSDFDCFSEGASCLDRGLFLQIQDLFGMLGFFWLDEKKGMGEAYYADLNDGTVYSTIKDSITSNQVLCVREKQG